MASKMNLILNKNQCLPCAQAWSWCIKNHSEFIDLIRIMASSIPDWVITSETDGLFLELCFWFQIRPYVNGTLYSILALTTIRQKAVSMVGLPLYQAWNTTLTMTYLTQLFLLFVPLQLMNNIQIIELTNQSCPFINLV